jgi:hypothetical protein
MRAMAVPEFERGDVAVGLVGDEHLVAEPFVLIEQAELRAGMRSFPPRDNPRVFRPVMLDEVGQLD